MRLNFLILGAAAVLLGSGLRTADAKQAPKPDKQGFYQLWNGNMDGWKVGDNPDTFKIVEGNLQVNGKGPAHLFYDGPVNNHDFKNFHLKVELMTFPHANSGVYIHTKYQDKDWPRQGFECQVNQTHADPKKSGSIYDVKNVMNESAAKDNEWYTYEAIVKDKTITLKINGKVVNEWTQPDEWHGTEGWPGRVIGSGTIAIQGHDPGSKVLYRSIKIKPLK